MSSQNELSPPNAFTADFLGRLDEIGEPDSAHEADVAGPWVIRPIRYRGDTGFALLREWESLEAGDTPYAVFRRREIALLAAAVLPATGRDLLLRLETEPDADGFPLLACPSPPGVAPKPTRPPAAPEGQAAPASPAAPAVTGALPASAPSPPERGGEPAAGHFRDFDEGLALALHLAAVLVRSPVALARLLEAAGHVALEQAGRILERRVH